MIELPHWVMIGAAGRNVGKTEFACELIARQKEFGPIYGVKITTIKDADGKCPRGGEGCGVCSSLGEDKWRITEETASDGKKDTCRMRAAGATKVLWLRVHHSHLAEGVAALNAAFPSGAPVVCESNSARTVLRPGVFLMIRQRGTEQMKASSRNVAGVADRIVEFDQNSWCLPPTQLGFFRKWRIKRNATAVVLAGGKSTRMGTDKSLLEVNGTPLIAQITAQLRSVFSEVLVSTNAPEKFSFLQLPMVTDEEPGLGPLMGIYSSVKKARYDTVFVTGCDIPTVNIPFVEKMIDDASGVDVILPVDDGGRFEPLFAVYNKSAALAMKTALDDKRLKVTAFMDDVVVKNVALPTGDWYRNLNTPTEFDSFVSAANGGKEAGV